MFKELLTHMLTAATLLIVKYWKSDEEVTDREWIEKVKYMCLVNKLTAIIRYRAGKVNVLKAFETEWKYFVESRYNRAGNNVRDCIVSGL